MSYTSDNEDYYDAFDITPLQSKSSLESSYGQTLTEISAKESASAHPLNKEKICKELSFDSKTSIITSYDTPLESDPSKTKCSVVILEPDIVQSTKSSSLPRQQLPTSTVTPRKKKSKSADIPLYNPEDLPASDKTHCLMAEEEENGSVTPKMPECSSPVLDITSATKGSCLVSLCDQVHPERSRRDSHESWDSVQSKDLSSTEDLLSTDHILDEEDEEEDANVYPDKNEQEGLPVDDDIDDTTRQASFSPTTFSTPLSSFSSHFTSAMSVSSTSTPDKLHSFATQENLHCTEFLSRAHHKGSRKSHLGRTCSNKATPPSFPLTTSSEKSQAARKDDLVEDKETTHDDEEDNEDEDNEDEEDEDDEIKESDKPSRLSDQEILNKTMVLNLDTGETVPLSSAEEKLPKCINPLSLHIMRRTKEYSSSDSNLHKQDVSDNDTAKVTQRKKSKPSSKKRMRIKQFFGKTVNRFKSVAEKNTHTDDTSTDDDDIVEHRKSIKIKHSHSHKGPYDFELLVPIQEIGDNKSGAVWTMKFSPCGRLLATGGQDALLRVWVLQDALQFFTDMRNKYNDVGRSTLRSNTSTDHETFPQSPEGDTDQSFFPFHRHPFSTYKGHTADVLDISWSKNYFLLSSSMDKTVRLWHASRFECLCCFQHIDFVTAISFHPKDDRYFLSGSLDGKLRLWNIPDKKVALWNEVVGGPVKLITAANFCLNGRFAVVGTYDGRCIFYNSEHLKYFTQIQVRSTRGRNKRGRKITGVEPFPGDNKILVTSNDSRIRLYDLRDLTLTCKYKGVTNNTSQIKASFSHDGRYVVCGSEDHFIYSWKTQHEFYKFSSARKDRNNYWEGIKAHPAVVTNAIFSPDPEAIIKPNFEFIDSEDKASHTGSKGEVIVSADFLGSIRIFVNKFKPPA